MKKNIRLTISLILSTPLLFAQGTIDREIFISRYYLQEIKFKAEKKNLKFINLNEGSGVFKRIDGDTTKIWTGGFNELNYLVKI